MTDTPEDWVLIEAAKRSSKIRWVSPDLHELRREYGDGDLFKALCDMIAKYEKEPVDRKLLCAREAWAELYEGEPEELNFRHGYCDDRDQVVCSIRAIELWEEGFGK